MVCCDTSFLFSLYGRDIHTAAAKAECQRLNQPLTLSSLNEFEFVNALRLSVFRKLFPSTEASLILANFAADLAVGKLEIATCNLASILSEAKRLSASHTVTSGHRAFDILHVATALHLQATQFLSFDVNQKQLAHAEGLKT